MPDETKKCLYCGEEILAVAIKCKHCQSMLDTGSGDSLDDASTQVPGMEDESLDGAATMQHGQARKLLAGRYEILEELGRGGMGIVFKGRDTKLGTLVAIKLLSKELESDLRGIELLKQEARTAMDLSHPNIVKLYNYEEHADGRFLVMEYVEGKTLEQVLIQKKKLSERRVRKYAVGICNALHYAHFKGVIHRDIKPSNIMLDKDGNIKITDFGIARTLKDSQTRQTGRITSGTLLYMSPEQLMGKEADARSDIYSLGITLYELLRGEPPFTGGDISMQHLKRPIDPIPEVSEEMNLIVQNCCAKELSNRAQGARQVRNALLIKPEAKAKRPSGTSQKEKPSVAVEAKRQIEIPLNRLAPPILVGCLIVGLVLYLAKGLISTSSDEVTPQLIMPVQPQPQEGIKPPPTEAELAERESVQKVVKVKVAAENARTRAKVSGAERFAPQSWQAGERKYQEGLRHDGQKEHTAAIQAFQAAASEFGKSETAAKKLSAQRKAEEARKARHAAEKAEQERQEQLAAKKFAEAAKRVMEQKRAAASQVSAASYAPGVWKAAEDERIKGDVCLNQQDYKSAEKCYSDAKNAYLKAREHARLEALDEQLKSKQKAIDQRKEQAYDWHMDKLRQLERAKASQSYFVSENNRYHREREALDQEEQDVLEWYYRQKDYIINDYD